MSRPVRTALMILIGLIAIAAPIGLALRVAHSQGLAAERRHVSSSADEALRRSVAMADQARQVLDRLAALAATGVERGSDQSVALMRELDLSYHYIRAIGAMSGTVMTCHSVGGRSEAVDLGPADMTSPRRMRVWDLVEVPFAPGQRPGSSANTVCAWLRAGCSADL
jgi:sensor c-di-GMP phosphodiesterase-like protein